MADIITATDLARSAARVGTPVVNAVRSDDPTTWLNSLTDFAKTVERILNKGDELGGLLGRISETKLRGNPGVTSERDRSNPTFQDKLTQRDGLASEAPAPQPTRPPAAAPAAPSANPSPPEAAPAREAVATGVDQETRELIEMANAIDQLDVLALVREIKQSVPDDWRALTLDELIGKYESLPGIARGMVDAYLKRRVIERLMNPAPAAPSAPEEQDAAEATKA